MTPTLPPLPEPLSNLPGYCRDAIESYARQAIAADRAALLPEVLRLADEMRRSLGDEIGAAHSLSSSEMDAHAEVGAKARAALSALLGGAP